MLKWIAGKLNNPVKGASQKGKTVLDAQGAGEWFSPQSAEILLATPVRKQALQQLWDNSPFSRAVWETLWLSPVKQLAVRVQQLPAAATGSYAREGGMLDEALEVAVCAVRLSRGWMLPPGAPPEEQAAQGAAWCTAIFWAALLHDLGSLDKMAAFHEDGRRWQAGLDAPDARWRVRFCEQTDHSAIRACASAYRLLPSEGLHWISRWPSLRDMLLVYLSGDKPAGAILHAAVSEARGKCGLPSQTESALPSLKSITDNSESIHQITPPDLGEHAADERGFAPFMSDVISDNDTQLPESSSVILAMPELGSAISEVFITEGDIEHGNESQPDGGSPGELLTMLDAMTRPISAPVAALAEPDESLPVSAPVEPVTEVQVGPGEHFWCWLVDSVRDGLLSVNTQDSLLHIMAQYVFIQTPDCFYRFLAAQDNPEADKDDVQKAFEALNKHYSRSGKGIYIYRKYESESREGRFTRMSGYMIMASQLFKENTTLTDSQWLSPNK
ncbi:TraI-2-C domain-containing protein [Erwinia rhapontici]|uniref:TraI domain-containing protein n=1 Tax=Erwinia rhapontici TaxID=55212 RepID=UPI003D36B64E